MKAVLLDAFGGPERLTLREVPTPRPLANEVLIRVVAAGVNFGDTIVRAGTAGVPIDLPWIPGSEVAGVIEQTGESAQNFAVGERVIAPLFLTGRLGGGYAEYVVVDVQARLDQGRLLELGEIDH